MRKRDLGVLIVSLSALFLSLQHGGDMSIRRIWTYPLDTMYYENHHSPAEEERLPPPLVVDLDGDGRNEIVLVTREPKLKVVALPSTATGNNVLPSDSELLTLYTKYEVSLLPHVRVSKGRQAVAFSVGHLSSTDNKQVIAVLTQEWSVLLFDHTLKLLWESTVQRDHPNFAGWFHKEASVMITPVGVHKNDFGAVIVGGSMAPVGSEHSHGAEGIEKKKRHEHEQEHNPGQDESEEFPNLIQDESESQFKEHFSLYAFEGKRGTLRWSHEADESHEEISAEEKFEPQHSYMAQQAPHVKHQGEVNWRHFRREVIRALPHQWHHREDTILATDAFETKEKRKKHRRSEDLDEGSDAEGHAERPPNVVLAHIRNGLEVIHLFTGRTLTRITLREGLHLDINGDGIVDHVQTYPGCYMMALSGVPPKEPLFNGSLCSPGGSLERITFAASGDLDKDVELIQLAAPVAVHHIEDIKTSMSQFASVLPVSLSTDNQRNQESGDAKRSPKHKVKPQKHQRHSQIQTKQESTQGSYHPRLVYDLAFLTSAGRVVSYSPHGHLNWQLGTNSMWSAEDSTDFPTLLPSLTVFTVRPESHQEHLVAVGAKTISVITSSGSLIDEQPLPEVPVALPVPGDWDNDGYNDLIVVTAKGFHGYVQERRVGSRFFAILVGLLAVVLVGFIIVNSSSETVEESGMRIREKKRSTD
eukprot:GILJ01012249.1.p1 GENE.GILJ01012249.1~~GILJ01012249.1.p1  ORF type:complete len:700 (+),score=92.80 GILJ01012249.1:149-2248(+)